MHASDGTKRFRYCKISAKLSAPDELSNHRAYRESAPPPSNPASLAIPARGVGKRAGERVLAVEVNRLLQFSHIADPGSRRRFASFVQPKHGRSTPQSRNDFADGSKRPGTDFGRW